jgi:hypothetical protein
MDDGDRRQHHDQAEALLSKPATVVYLDATSEGGLALILRPQGAPAEALELEGLTIAAAMELSAELGYAVEEGESAICGSLRGVVAYRDGATARRLDAV